LSVFSYEIRIASALLDRIGNDRKLVELIRVSCELLYSSRISVLYVTLASPSYVQRV